jgi:hypothetical protein
LINFICSYEKRTKKPVKILLGKGREEMRENGGVNLIKVHCKYI